jgi:nucleotide-binding universal stress UspA family protein
MTAPIQTILTGVDNSDTAVAAAERAADLAAAIGARLHVISAYGQFEGETLAVGSDQFELSNEDDAGARASGVAAGLRAARPGLEVTTAPAEGKPGEALVRVASEIDADLIVVGNKRVQGITRVFGSIASHVAAHASCDLYIVHTHQR